jgi:hypothetical protein
LCESLETLEIDDTEDLRHFLRGPALSREDEGLVGETKYTWDPRTDIIYTDAETESGSLSLSFLKPLIHRRSFLGGRLRFPKTAQDILNTKLGGEILIVAYPDMEKYESEQKRCWKVWFFEVDLGRRMKSIESELMTILDVALLFECEQIFDVDTGLRHPTRIAVSKSTMVEFSESVFNYQRIGEYLARKEFQDGIR